MTDKNLLFSRPQVLDAARVMRHRNLFGIWPVVAALGLSLGAMASDQQAELSQSLLPVPSSLKVLDEERVLPATPLPLVCAFAPEAIAWDPLKVLSSSNAGPVLVRPNTPDPGLWAVALMRPRHQPSPGLFQAAQQEARPLGEEGYVLETFATPETVAVLAAGGPRGLLYGCQTLAQLLQRRPGFLPHVKISDRPDIAARELHVHGFDKGYGAGDLKDVRAFTDLLPEFLPAVARGRFNLFRFSLDAGWINEGDRWVGRNLDEVMKAAVAEAHRNGVDVLMEVRCSGQRAASSEPDLYPLDPVGDWATYEKALRRALRWGPDALDLSFNDLGALKYPDVVNRYGGDGRFSGKLMAELLQKTQAIIAEEKPGTRLYHLPRFYGPIHWKQHPAALPDLWANAPTGVVMSATGILDPPAAKARQKYGAHFQLWVNYSSNHAKEMRVILAGPAREGAAAEIEPLRQTLPFTERRVLLNLGYPVEPQACVAMATGEWLWNEKAYETYAALDKAARQLWGRAAAARVVDYARLLDWETTTRSLGLRAAGLLKQNAPAEEDEGVGHNPRAKRDGIALWREYRRRADAAAELATSLGQEAASPELKRIAEMLYWNAQRVSLDSQIGCLLAKAAVPGNVDHANVEELLSQQEAILRDHFRVEKNDPKSAEVSTRGIRRVREALKRSE